MRIVPVSTVGSVPAEVVIRASAYFDRRQTLANVFEWSRQQSPPAEVLEITTQDEYTHDVVMSFDGSHLLAFDAT